ncbi:APC family permease [Halalkalibacter krulwichiae]|uniref:Putative amino acid permease YhdG n=1 Tax=Halalkalibacter krulwichiae TaxID=199441 RepID=A0A1X9MHQ8_9BACI|nr:APC family permease [Halalkalibacter krulwichiae]ARK32090.1 putative amino acid permease YhdG [Halalkalibacter krulwichiae]
MAQRSELARSIKPSWVWSIAFGSSIGWGAFILPTDWVNQSGSIGAMIGLGLGATIMMMIAICYGVLIRRYPVSGGGYAYAYLSSGRNWAFITGWFMVLGYASIVALNASAFSLLLKYLNPLFMKQGYLYTIAGWEVYIPELIISSIMIVLFALFNIKGSKFSGKLQLFFSVILAVGVVIIAIYTFNFADFPLMNMQPAFNENQSITVSILVVLAIAPWAYVGFDNVPQAAEEFKFSTQKTTMLIILSLLSSGLVYIVMIGVASWTFDISNFNSNSGLWLIGDIIYSSAGIMGLLVLTIVIIMGIFTGLNGFLNSSSRLLYSMARGRALPKFFEDLHPKYQTPYKAIWFIAITMLPLMLFGRPALSWIVDMASIGVTVGYLFTCIAAYKLLSWKRSGNQVFAPIKKLIALSGITFSIIFILLLLIPISPAALKMPSIIALIAWFLIGFIFYLFIRKDYSRIDEKDLRYYILNDD